MKVDDFVTLMSLLIVIVTFIMWYRKGVDSYDINDFYEKFESYG